MVATLERGFIETRIPTGDTYIPERELPAFFWIADKAGQRVRLRPNRMQAHYLKSRGPRVVKVKARQQGSTTIDRANFTAKTVWHPDTRFVQVVETEQKAKRDKAIVQSWVESIPPQWRPTIGVNNATSITFPKIGSRIDFYWAEGETPGRGDTITYLLCSEVAHWPNPEKTLGGLFPSVPPPHLGGEIVLESTPNGASGFFYEMYRAAKKGVATEDEDEVWQPLFYEWWWSDEYRKTPGKSLHQTLSHEERDLMRLHGLDLEQIAWRRWQMRESERLGGLFLQEYPEDDVSCFFSAGAHVFDPRIVSGLREYAEKPRPMPEGWEEDGYGNALQVWKEPMPGARYVIGVDTAEGLGGPGRDADYSAAAVLDWRTAEHVCTLRTNRLPPERFAALLDNLGRRYETYGTPAYIAVERRSSGYAVLNALRDDYGYPNLHVEISQAASTRSFKEYEAGWMTTNKNKAVMVGDFATAIRAGDFVTHDETLVDEIANYVYDDTGHLSNPNVDVRSFASPGAHDDLLMAAMIAYQVRDVAPLPKSLQPKPKRLVNF